jgi:hypothetical protein
MLMEPPKAVDAVHLYVAHRRAARLCTPPLAHRLPEMEHEC